MRYIVTKVFHSGLLKGMVINEQTDILFKVGCRTSEYTIVRVEDTMNLWYSGI